MSSLTTEQLQRIEENRRKALERKSANANQQVSSSGAGVPFKGVSSSNFYGTSGVKKALNVTTVSHGPSVKRFKPGEQNNVPKKDQPPINTINQHSAELKLTANNSGLCKVISAERFSVNIGYNQQTIEVFKQVPSKLYDMKSRTWSFTIEDHDYLLDALKKLKPQVFVTPIPIKIRKLLLEASKPVPVIDISHLDKSCLEALMPFQVEGVKFCIAKGGRALLADDMGLGKTIQALAVADYYKKDWPLLIVCPSSVRFSWAESFRMWLPSVPWHELVVMTNGKEFIQDAKILILSYDLVTRQTEVLKKMNFGMLILDESHSLKNFTSKRSKAIQPLVKLAKRVILLSGTPALSRPIELYFQLTIINPGSMISIDEYGKRYCAATQKAWGMDYSGSSNMDELNIILQECFLIRRLKKNVLTQLPGKFRQTIVLPEKSISYERKELLLAKEKMHNVQGAQKHGALLSYYNETSSVKTKAICDYIGQLLDADKKFICFAHHAIVLDAICDTLVLKKCRYIRIDGATAAVTRQEMCQTFQQDDKCRAAVLSITAANSGITLTAAHLVVFAELFWNPGIMLQAEDRVHRIGQQNSVVVQYLVAKDTSDDHMWNLLQKKLNVLNKAGLNQDNMTATSSTRTLQDEDQSKITKFFQTSQAERDEKKALEDELFLDDLDWDSIDAEVASKS